MRKFWMGLVACSLMLVAAESAYADHNHHSRGGNCRPYGGSPYAGRVHTHSSGGIYRSPGYGGYGGYGGHRGHGGYQTLFPGFGNPYVPYGGAGYGPGCRNNGSGIGIYFRF